MKKPASRQAGRKHTPLLLLLWVCAPFTAAAATADPACAPLCGTWQLDAAASDVPSKQLDQAFAQFKEPKPRRQFIPDGDSLPEMARVDEEAAIGPVLKRPRGKDLREELEQVIYQPQRMTIGAAEDGIRVKVDDQPSALSLTPGANHARVDRYGTAKISVRWQKRQLVVSETYNGGNWQDTTYAVQASDGSLHVTQVIDRSGLPKIKVHSVYRAP